MFCVVFGPGVGATQDMLGGWLGKFGWGGRMVFLKQLYPFLMYNNERSTFRAHFEKY